MTNQAMYEFKLQIYQLLSNIPVGKVISYGELARLAGQPNYARQVGRLLKELPKNSSLPWYRVVNSQMKISFEVDSPAYLRQKKALENEGWSIENGKIRHLNTTKINL